MPLSPPWRRRRRSLPELPAAAEVALEDEDRDLLGTWRTSAGPDEDPPTAVKVHRGADGSTGPWREPPDPAMVGETPMWRFLPMLALAPLLAAAAPGRGGADLRVLSYNVNYGLAGDLETMDAIAAADADVVFLQEADGVWAAALRERFASRYPHQARVESSPAGSLVVLSRWRLDEGDVVDSPAGWFPLWRVVVHTPAGDLQALQVHLHPPYDERGGWVLGPFVTGDERAAELAAGLASLDPALPTVVLGDFNERRGDALRLAVDAGLRDAVVAFDPDAVTWRWDLPVGRLTGQLDHLFHDARVEVLRLEVRDAGRSDHLPIVADLRLARGG